MLHLVVGLLSLVALAFLLAEFFIVFLLPRRVNRDPAIARAILRTFWIPWRAGARRLHRRRPTFLAIAIGYLPALFQAFSRRERPWPGSIRGRVSAQPGRLLERSGERGGWASSTSTCSSGRRGRPS